MLSAGHPGASKEVLTCPQQLQADVSAHRLGEGDMSFRRGLVIGVPLSLVLWALIIAALWQIDTLFLRW